MLFGHFYFFRHYCVILYQVQISTVSDPKNWEIFLFLGSLKKYPVNIPKFRTFSHNLLLNPEAEDFTTFWKVKSSAPELFIINENPKIQILVLTFEPVNQTP